MRGSGARLSMFLTPMTKSFRRAQKGFTLIELLTVVAIIGILAAIIIPTVGKVQQTARRATDSSNLRQIGQSSLIYAQLNKDQLPSNSLSTTAASYGENVSTGGTAATVKLIAGALAKHGGLESGQLWVSKADTTTTLESQNANVGNILDQTKAALDANFNTANLAFGYVAGLSTNYSSTTPVAFTRGIVGSTDGKWSASKGTYADDGGHIVYIGGNVSFYKSLGSSATNGELINGSSGAKTNVITATVPSTKTGVRFVEEDASATSSSTAATGSSS